MRAYAGHARAILGFALVPALSLLSTLFVLPLISRHFGAPGWIALTVGQSVGALVGVAVALGWPMVGANAIAAASPVERVQLARDSVTSSALMMLVAVPIGCCIDALVVHTHLASAMLFTLATAGNGLTFSWYYAGARTPRLLLTNEALIRLGGNLLAIPLLMVYPSLYAYAGLMILVAITMVTLNMRATCRADIPWSWAGGVRHIREYAHLTGARTFMAMGSYLSSSIVGAVSPGSLANFSALDRIQKSAGNATDAVPAGLAGWVSAPPPGSADRERRVRIAFVAALVEAVGIFVAWLLLGQMVSGFLFSSAVRVGFLANAIVGLCIALYACNTMLAQLVMIPSGWVAMVTRANAVAAPVGIVGVALGAHLAGVTGALAGAALAACVPVVLFVCTFGRPRATPRRAVTRGSESMTTSRRLWGLARLRILVALLAGAVLGGVVGATYAAVTGRSYTSTASVLLSVTGANQPSELSAGLTYITDSMKTYAVLAKSDSVVTAPVVAASGVSRTEVEQRLTVAGEANTTILDFTYVDKDPVVSQRTAQSAAESFVGVLPDAKASSGGKPLVSARLIMPAQRGTSSSLSSPVTLGTAGALVGAAIALVAVAAASTPSRQLVQRLRRASLPREE